MFWLGFYLGGVVFILFVMFLNVLRFDVEPDKRNDEAFMAVFTRSGLWGLGAATIFPVLGAIFIAVAASKYHDERDG